MSLGIVFCKGYQVRSCYSCYNCNGKKIKHEINFSFFYAKKDQTLAAMFKRLSFFTKCYSNKTTKIGKHEIVKCLIGSLQIKYDSQ